MSILSSTHIPSKRRKTWTPKPYNPNTVASETVRIRHELKQQQAKKNENEGILVDNDSNTIKQVYIQFQSIDGIPLGSALAIDLSVTQAQLNELINTLLNQSDQPLPYNFYLHQNEIVENLYTCIKKQQELLSSTLSLENTLPIVYQPQSIFRVRAATRCTSSLPGHSEPILHCSFSPCSRYLATGSGDTTVRIWEVFTATPMHTCKGHRHWVLAVAWSPNSRYVASGSMDCELRVWVAETGKLIGDVNKSNTTDSMNEVSDDDNKNIEPSTTSINSTNNSLKNEKATTTSTSTNNTKPHIKLKNKLSNGKGKSTTEGTAKPILAKGLIGHKKPITCISWEPFHLNPHCTRVCTGSQDGDIRIWDVVMGKCAMILSGHTHSITSVKWGGSGYIYSASQDRTIKVWDISSGAGKLYKTLEGHAHWVNHLALSTDCVLRTGAYDHYGNQAATIDDQQSTALNKYNDAISLNNNAEILVSGSDDFTLCMWNAMESNKPIHRITGHQQPINWVTYSPDSRYIASASFDKSVKIWNGMNGAFVSTLRGHVQAVYQCCFSADSRLIVSSSKDSTIKLWDIKSKKMISDLPGHCDEVYACDWSMNGEYVASGGRDQILKLWRH